MLMSLPELVEKHHMNIDGVLHVGAHLAEEAQIYDELGIRNVAWIEANPAVIPKIKAVLASYPNQFVIEALVHAVEGAQVEFNVTNYDGMSSSIFEFGTHPTFSPDTVFVDKLKLVTRTIDSLTEQFGVVANFLNMDLQGAELLALQGATDFLCEVDFIMTEVNQAEVYVGCAQIGQIDEYLEVFNRVETHWVPDQGWGDALYIRKGYGY